jgi:hypothetical protein
VRRQRRRPAFGATGRTLAGVSCDTPPPCTARSTAAPRAARQPGNAKEPKSGRSFFLDYPCDLKPGEPVVLLSEPARRRLDRQLAAALLPGARLQGQVPPRDRDADRGHDRHDHAGAPGVRMWNADADDAFLRDLVDYVFAEVGRASIKSFWLVGHSQGGMTSNRIVCTDFFKDKVDGWLSLSGGRIGRAEVAPDFFGPSGPPAALAGGSGPRPGVAAMPACDINFIFTSGEKEIVSLPEASPWAQQYGCDARARQKDIVDGSKGYVTGATAGRGASWGREARPGTAEVFVYPKCKGKKVVADVLRMDKGHTEGLEPKVTESLVAMMASAPGGKARLAKAAGTRGHAAEGRRLAGRAHPAHRGPAGHRAAHGGRLPARARFVELEGVRLVLRHRRRADRQRHQHQRARGIEAYFNRPRPARAGAPANPEPRVGKHVVTNLTIQITATAPPRRATGRP